MQQSSTPDSRSNLNGYEVAPVRTAVEREAVFAVRMTVFVEEQGVPPEEELDHYDVTAAHFLVRTVHAADTRSEIIGRRACWTRGAGSARSGVWRF